MSNKTQANLDHHANQMNPNNQAYQARMNNHSCQLNPNNWRYQPPKGGK